MLIGSVVFIVNTKNTHKKSSSNWHHFVAMQLPAGLKRDTETRSHVLKADIIRNDVGSLTFKILSVKSEWRWQCEICYHGNQGPVAMATTHKHIVLTPEQRWQQWFLIYIRTLYPSSAVDIIFVIEIMTKYNKFNAELVQNLVIWPHGYEWRFHGNR